MIRGEERPQTAASVHIRSRRDEGHRPAAGEEAGAQEREDVCASRRDRSKQVQVRGPQCKQRDAAVLRRRENGAGAGLQRGERALENRSRRQDIAAYDDRVSPEGFGLAGRALQALAQGRAPLGDP